MHIVTKDLRFVPTNFVIDEFYGVITCFCWDGNKLAMFPYNEEEACTDGIPLLIAPGRIRNIICFSGRIFLLCIPHGIYKLSRDQNFAVLSKHAVGIGTVFYEILTPRNNCLYLDNKQNKTSKSLFQLSGNSEAFQKLCVFTLNVEGADPCLMTALKDNEGPVRNVTLIGNEKKLLVLTNETVRIIYNDDCPIKHISPVRKNNKTIGVLLLINADRVVIMHVKENKLVYEKVHLRTNIRALCAYASSLVDDALLIVYSDERMLYHVKIRFFTNKIQQVYSEERNVCCLMNYGFNQVLGLASNDLFTLPTTALERSLASENSGFINLRSEMLRGTESIVNEIYEKSKMLKILNERLLQEQDKLKRINLYAHEQLIRASPKMSIQRISGQQFLSIDFAQELPKNSTVVVSLDLGWWRRFYSKRVTSSDTVIEMRVSEGHVFNGVQIAMDMVMLTCEGAPWCLIRNAINDTPRDKGRKRRTKKDMTNFINAKIASLKNLISEGAISMEKLAEIKRSVRKALQDS
ncbi:hypothetical protein KM043_001056 [Ampulex compressa]|nr:hypothetical protein KM043_001056 [Ampulex compressa]